MPSRSSQVESIKSQPAAELPTATNCPSSVAGTEKVAETSSESVGVHQVLARVVDELGDVLELKSAVQHFAGPKQNKTIQSSIIKQEVAAAMSEKGVDSKFLQNGALEELEPLELTPPCSSISSTSNFAAPPKPLIRLSFTSLGKASSGNPS